MADLTTFPGRLAFLLEGKNVSEVSRIVGVTPASIRRYLAGSEPGAAVGIKLSDHFDVRLDWLIMGRGPMRPPVSDPNWPEAPLIQSEDDEVFKATITEILTYEIAQGWKIDPKKLGERALALYRAVNEDRRTAKAAGKQVSGDPAVDVVRYLNLVEKLAGGNNDR